MKTIIQLCEYYNKDYNDTYRVYRVQEDDTITVLLQNLHESPYGIRSFFRYDDIGEELKSELISWYNLFFFCKQDGTNPNSEYMKQAVLNNQKTTATTYFTTSDEKYKDFVSTLPDGFQIVEINPTEQYLCRQGSLSDYFCFDQVKHIYGLLGVNYVDWDRVHELLSIPLIDFADEGKCGLSIENVLYTSEYAQCIITGLLLGYPIESTATCLKDDNNHKWFKDLMHQQIKKEAEEYFNKFDDHTTYVDQKTGVKCLKNNDRLFIDGQQESLYFKNDPFNVL